MHTRNNRLQVFDRSGKLVYEKQNYANNWDGKIQNRALVNDTYFYVLTVNGKVIKKGSVTIIK
jgi:gliding motility-associated-like protein